MIFHSIEFATYLIATRLNKKVKNPSPLNGRGQVRVHPPFYSLPSREGIYFYFSTLSCLQLAKFGL